MSEPWHIPRASLGSISSHSNKSSKASSRRSSLDDPSRRHQPRSSHGGHLNRGYQTETGTLLTVSSTVDLPPLRTHRSQTRINELKQRFEDYSGARRPDDGREVVPKRGSRSSQGSTDSNHSSHSASSGSMLLTVANLENFAKIHRHKIDEEQESPIRNYNANITMSNAEFSRSKLERHEHAAISIHPDRLKAKDVDSISVASSTHFTVVNGVGGPPRVPKSGLCDRGHQITVLIVTMSIVFMIGISAAVFFMEMRARDMPY